MLTIHLICYQIPGRTLPSEWSNSIKSWVDMHPDGRVMVWDNENLDRFVGELSPEYRAIYDELEYWIQKFDFIRLIILLKYGGMYSDLDIVPTKPFYFIESYDMPFFCSFRHSDEQRSVIYYNNSIFGAPRNHPLIKEIIEGLILNHRNRIGKGYRTKIFRVLLSTGPFALTNILMNTKHPYVTLPRGLINSCHIDEPYPCQGEDAIVQHLKGGSWLSFEDAAYKRFFEVARGSNVLIVLAIILSFMIVWLAMVL